MFEMNDLIVAIHEMVGASPLERISIHECIRSNTSYVLRVSVEGESVRHLFVKTAVKAKGDDPFWSLCIHEVEFYEFINSSECRRVLSIPRCRGYSILPDNTGYYLVLDDVTDTHLCWQDIEFVDIETWTQIIRALAGFQVSFLNSLSNEQFTQLSPGSDDVNAHIERLKNAYARFRNEFTDCVKRPVLLLLEKSIPLMEKFETEKRRRLQQREYVTITHGDLHVKNVMYPKKQDELPLLIDWQFWGVGVGVLDLRHLVGSGLPKAMRRHQRALVKLHYDILNEKMGNSYSWDECWSDYKMGIIDNLFMPVWQYAGFGWGYERWNEYLERAVENYYELGCDEMQ